MRTLLILTSFLLMGADWITMPSTYTHRNGERVTQYQEIPRVFVQYPPVLQSGYRHTESVLGRDRLHIIEEWGRPVRPYGEWQYPYRPYSVPYHLWGPQPAPNFIFP